MSCFQPIDCWEVLDNETGEVSQVFKIGLPGLSLLKGFKVPCGQCVGCRMDKAKAWAVRCMHEAQLHSENCFITLTYNPENLPPDGSVHLEHFTNFLKRFREYVRINFGVTFRFFHCGEYGELLSRPHYHACIFGYDFPDKEFYKEVRNEKLYLSKSLQALWPSGFSTVGSVTIRSACYVARYITKKITGKIAKDHYKGRKPEYITMSRRPGLGKGWYEKFKGDIFPSDQVIIDSMPVKVPRYYDKIFDIESPRAFEKVKARRVIRAEKFLSEQTLPRRKARMVCLKADLKFKKRSFENGPI